MDTLNRTVYARVFRGTHAEIADVGPWNLIGSIFDKTYMPALLLAPGKQAYYEFSLAQSATQLVALPQNYVSPNRLYVAVLVDAKVTLQLVSPTHGASDIVLQGTNTTLQGFHPGFWVYQGDLTSLTVAIPTTGQGGVTTSVKIFMYEIPDLNDFQSYYDKQIGYGVSGDV